MEFQLSNALLRPWRAGDEDSLAYHANNRKIWRNLRDAFPHPYRLSDAQEYIRHHGEYAFAIDVDEHAVGSIALHPKQDVASRSAEIGYWLGEAYWGRGIMTEAVKLLTTFGLQDLGVIRIYAAVFEWNRPSMRVLEKAGYSFEGRHRKAVTKDGQTIDEFMYAKVRDE